MRTALLSRLLLAFLALGTATAGLAQGVKPTQLLTADASTAPEAVAATATSTATNTMTLKGHVETLEGTLRGAVITLRDYQNMKVVTDADGYFFLTIPTSNQPIAITASYAGYDDVVTTLTPGTQASVVRLTGYHDIKVRKKDQLKSYLKTARKQIKKQLRQIPRS